MRWQMGLRPVLGPYLRKRLFAWCNRALEVFGHSHYTMPWCVDEGPGPDDLGVGAVQYVKVVGMGSGRNWAVW